MIPTPARCRVLRSATAARHWVRLHGRSTAHVVPGAAVGATPLHNQPYNRRAGATQTVLQSGSERRTTSPGHAQVRWFAKTNARRGADDRCGRATRRQVLDARQTEKRCTHRLGGRYQKQRRGPGPWPPMGSIDSGTVVRDGPLIATAFQWADACARQAVSHGKTNPQNQPPHAASLAATDPLPRGPPQSGRGSNPPQNLEPSHASAAPHSLVAQG